MRVLLRGTVFFVDSCFMAGRDVQRIGNVNLFLLTILTGNFTMDTGTK